MSIINLQNKLIFGNILFVKQQCDNSNLSFLNQKANCSLAQQHIQTFKNQNAYRADWNSEKISFSKWKTISRSKIKKFVKIFT